MTRELDDLILRPAHQRAGASAPGYSGPKATPAPVLAYDRLLLRHADDWLANEIVHYLKRTLKRLDVTSRSLIALIEPGSCFAGSLLELALAADRSYQLVGIFEDVDPTPSRPHHRRRDEPRRVTDGQRPDPATDALLRRRRRLSPRCAKRAGEALPAEAPRRSAWSRSPPTTSTGTTRCGSRIEERASFSPDALSGMEANYRFAGPETIETKIFGRLTAWQNWIFYRPNAVGPERRAAPIRHRSAAPTSTGSECER